MTRARTMQWRAVAHPLAMVLRKGWRLGRCSLVSPRGTVFATRLTGHGLVARRATLLDN